jgi:hypothetical protein
VRNCHFRVTLAVNANARLQGVFEQFHRVLVQPHAAVDASNRSQQRGARFRLLVQAEPDASSANVQHFTRCHLIAATARRIGQLEQLDQER